MSPWWSIEPAILCLTRLEHVSLGLGGHTEERFRGLLQGSVKAEELVMWYNWGSFSHVDCQKPPPGFVRFSFWGVDTPDILPYRHSNYWT